MVVRDIDLLTLSRLLPEVDRVVVLPVDALVTADIGELADLDLGDNLLAAPTVVGTTGSSGFGVIHAASMRLGPKTKVSTELRRQAFARHAFDFDSFTSDVLVLDLTGARSQGFVDEYLPYVEEFGLTWRDVLHFAFGPHRVVVPENWDCVPTRSTVDRPGLVHWADPVKPWHDGYTAEQERWLGVADALEQRRG
jgi:lipopolysaccharide biosynthesis glycosyltransferase